MDNIIQCNALVKYYGKHLAIDNIDLNIPRGKIVGLLGSNGSGKTTLIKLACGLLTPTEGIITVGGMEVGVTTKQGVSYLPERTYFSGNQRVTDVVALFTDFYLDFDKVKAYEMLSRLNINPMDRLSSMSKGTKEKVQLILVMSRHAQLFLLDEPIGGVDPAARDYILNTIIGNYSENSTVVISTHLIQDVEQILDEVIFISRGKIVLEASVDSIREEQGKSVDALFREVFKC